MSTNSLTEEEQSILESIFRDLQILFGKDEIRSEEIGGVVDRLESEEAKSYINSLKEAKPESALSDAFFAGRSILKKYLFGTATPEAVVGDGFVDFKVTASGGKIMLVELKPLFEAKTIRVKAGRELKSLKQTKLNPEAHKQQILKYIQKGGEYIILTNLKEWFFFSRSVTAAEFEPFASTHLMEFRKEFEVERDLWDYLTRLDQRSIKEDLDAYFFRSLKMWVSKLSEVEFTVDDQRKTELMISLINKFIFIQTLDDYRVIEPRWIQETWSRKERRWGRKGKEQMLREFFKEVDNWFYQYYDTELFRDAILNHVKQDEQNFDLLHKNLRLVLGLEYWMSALGGFRGIMQYNFQYIDEDILGKAYETYLAGVRHDEGIYYTPKFVTKYIVETTVGNKLDDFVRRIKAGLEKENFEEVREALIEFTSVRVLDPACGSGSFLIKAVRKIVEKYKEVQNLLKDAERKHNKWQGSLYRPKDVEEKVEKIHQAMETLGPRNDRELIARILVRHIHGNDLDRRALEVAKVNIWLEAIKLSPAEFRYDRLPAETNYILPDLQMNFCNGDSVVGLPENWTVQYLHEKHKNDVFELCELRRKYLADPSDPQLVKRIIEVKSNLRRQLDEKFREYLSEKGLPVEVLKETIPFHWALDFWYFYFNDEGELLPEHSRGADIVIGNPPYERIQVLNKKSPTYVRYLNNSGFESAFKNYDLAIIFVEKGFGLLRKKGEFGFIVTNKFMQADYGKSIRNLLSSNKCIREIVDFGYQQVFEDATTYTALLFLEKTHRSEITYARVSNLSRDIDQLRFVHSSKSTNGNQGITVFKVDHDSLSPDPWVFVTPEEATIMSKLRTISKLTTICKEMFVGLQTSADKVYVLEPLESKNGLIEVFSRAMNKKYLLETDLIKPFLHGRNIKRWFVEENEYVVLFPYRIFNKRAELLTVEELGSKFPRTWQYLKDNKEELESRERGRIAGSPYWYGYVYLKNMEKFDQPKIITQVLAKKASFALDLDSEFYFAGAGGANGYGITVKTAPQVSLKYLCGLLNSSLLDWYLKRISTAYRGGYYIYAKRFLERLPIYVPEKKMLSVLEGLVDKVVSHIRASYHWLRFWSEWATKLKTNEYSLERILKQDLQEIQKGAFEKAWTSNVTFYPGGDQVALSKTYDKFQLVGVPQSHSIRVFGLDESNREELVYVIEFKDNNLMKHVYASIVSLLDSRKRVNRLSDILLKTVVPVITSNPLQQTPNIIKKVEEEFSEWKQRNKLTDIQSESLCKIQNDIQNIEAKIDSLVFVLYDLDRNEVTTVLEALSLPSSYQEKVISYLDDS